MVVAVSVNGVQAWAEGFGYSDVEQLTPCTKDTVMRIASISKTVTAVIAAKLVDEGKLNLDQPVQARSRLLRTEMLYIHFRLQKYVADFPEKTFEGKKVTITPRHLLSHTSGIRHYKYGKFDFEVGFLKKICAIMNSAVTSLYRVFPR